MELKPIEKVEKNDYFRLKGKKKVYLAKGYCRTNKKYEGVEYEDISTSKYLIKGTIVETDFDF